MSGISDTFTYLPYSSFLALWEGRKRPAWGRQVAGEAGAADGGLPADAAGELQHAGVEVNQTGWVGSLAEEEMEVVSLRQPNFQPWQEEPVSLLVP